MIVYPDCPQWWHDQGWSRTTSPYAPQRGYAEPDWQSELRRIVREEIERALKGDGYGLRQPQDGNR